MVDLPYNQVEAENINIVLAGSLFFNISNRQNGFSKSRNRADHELANKF